MTTMRDRTRPEPPAPRRRWQPRFVAAGVLTVLALLATLPDRLGGLDRFTPFAQVVAFRPLVVAAVGLLGLVALVITAMRRRWWPFAAGLLAVAITGAALLVPRLVAAPPPTGGQPLTVLTFNVYQGRADPAAVTALIAAERPDLVSLPEAGVRYRDRIAPLVAPLGYRAQASSQPGEQDKWGVTLLVSDRLGAVDVTVGTSTDIPYLQATGGGLGALRFVAMHTRSPVPERIDRWRADLAQLPHWCAGQTPAVVAGDLNATFDHSLLRTGAVGCVDAADQRGAGLTPTWGPWRKASVGPQIDHVLATTGIAAESVQIRDLPTSDHRAVLARLRVPA